jgi:hypothetical protein
MAEISNEEKLSQYSRKFDVLNNIIISIVI